MRAPYRFSQALGILSFSSCSGMLSLTPLFYFRKSIHLVNHHYHQHHHYYPKGTQITTPKEDLASSRKQKEIHSGFFTPSRFHSLSLLSDPVCTCKRLLHTHTPTSSLSFRKSTIHNGVESRRTESSVTGNLNAGYGCRSCKESEKPIFTSCRRGNSGRTGPSEALREQWRNTSSISFPHGADDHGGRTIKLTEEETKQLWKAQLVERYGLGSYPLFCAIYKDLCEELKRELYTKPPSKFETSPSCGPSPSVPNVSSPSSSSPSSSSPSTSSSTISTTKEREQGNASWKVQYYPATNTLVFDRPPLPVESTSATFFSSSFIANTPAASKIVEGAAASAHIWAYAKVHVTDPPKLNALLTFADWCALDVFVERQGHILHFSIASNEGGMHMRNVRIYDATMPLDAPLKLEKEAERYSKSRSCLSRNEEKVDEGPHPPPPSLQHTSKGDDADEGKELNVHGSGNANDKKPLSDAGVTPYSSSSSPLTIRDIFFGDTLAGPGAFDTVRHWFYDGPCLWHLELDFQNEMYDLLQDYGITLDWVRWASEWVFFYEHRLSVQWMCSVLLDLIPAYRQGPEEHFLTEEERAVLDEPASDWIREPLS